MTLAFDRVRFVMTEPSHPGNVGSAARAIKTMGFTELALVAPRTSEIADQPEAIALASGATDVLGAAVTYPALADALAPVTLAFALTARERDLGPPTLDIREAALLAASHLAGHPDARVAIVAGTERSGLTNAQVALCHRVCHIPANPAYSSLNVAQALQLAAWEMRYALLNPSDGAPVAARPALEDVIGEAGARAGDGGANRASDDPGRRPASSEAVQALITHLEQALEAVKFLDPAHPKKLMPRMRHLFGRSALTQDEVDMWRGVCTAMIATARRAYPPGKSG